MTCGFLYAGGPAEDNGTPLGLHGRAHHTAARHVGASTEWENDEYVMRVRGVVEETFIYGEFVRLTREITSKLGSNRLTITDQFENLAFAPTSLMLLYHFNFGFPLLTETTQLSFPSNTIEPRLPEHPMTGYDRWVAPDPAYDARVYIHKDLKSDNQQWTSVSISNPEFPLPTGPHPVRVGIHWDTSTLPYLTEWHMAGAGTHVLGIEPTNCHVSGRAASRENNMLVTLEPGAKVTCRLAIDVNLG